MDAVSACLSTTCSFLQCFMYEGKTGDFVGQVNDSEGKIHKGGVYGVSMFAGTGS